MRKLTRKQLHARLGKLYFYIGQSGIDANTLTEIIKGRTSKISPCQESLELTTKLLHVAHLTAMRAYDELEMVDFDSQ